jgi:acetate---CoA ligase (ADP-forming)
MASATASDTVVFTSERLKQFFEPKSIALIGASDKSMWSIMVNGSLRACGFPGEIAYVNPRSPTVHGQPTVPSLAAIGAPVDLAFIMVNTSLVLPILQEMAAAGVQNAVILAGGFAEAGAEGQALQQQVVQIAKEHDLALLGPNCLGYLNYGHNVGAMPGVPANKLRRGGVGIASQSGATGNLMMTYATRQGIGLSAMISSGNEAVLSVNDAIEYLIDDSNTQVIAVFMESIRHPQAFVRAAKRARAIGKPIIAIKAGRSVASQRVAQAHTGALTGDDKVIDALFHQIGIMRVDSIEQLLTTADLFTKTGALAGRRLGFMSISGGLCDIGADIAEASGLELPAWSAATQQRLRELLPELGDIHNPLDTTGAAVNRPELLAQMAAVLEDDLGIDVLVTPQTYPEAGTPAEGFSKNMLTLIDQHLKSDRIPVLIPENSAIDMPPAAQEFLDTTRLKPAPGGMAETVRALGRIAAWSAALRANAGNPAEAQVISAITVEGDRTGAWSEHQARAFLAQQDVPVIPAKLVTSADDAAAAARTLGFPVVLKIASPDILHKSDIGGVKLNLRDEHAVRAAFDAVMQAAQEHAPRARIEGTLVSPMRSGGIELLVGVVHDASFGQVLAVGLGGIYVEVLKDASLRVLPIGRAEVQAMLDELHGKALLHGARGSNPANMDALTDAIMRVAQLAQALGDDLESLEINPLRVDGDQIEALDAVLTWRSLETPLTRMIVE